MRSLQGEIGKALQYVPCAFPAESRSGAETEGAVVEISGRNWNTTVDVRVDCRIVVGRSGVSLLLIKSVVGRRHGKVGILVMRDCLVDQTKVASVPVGMRRGKQFRESSRSLEGGTCILMAGNYC